MRESACRAGTGGGEPGRRGRPRAARGAAAVRLCPGRGARTPLRSAARWLRPASSSSEWRSLTCDLLVESQAQVLVARQLSLWSWLRCRPQGAPKALRCRRHSTPARARCSPDGPRAAKGVRRGQRHGRPVRTGPCTPPRPALRAGGRS